MIRFAVETDLVAVVELLRAFHAEAGMTFPFRAAYGERLFRLHVNDADSCCLVLGERPHGVLMAKAFEHPYGAGRWAKETIWYVAREHRGQGGSAMLDAYEAWARRKGCVVIGLTALATNDVSALYRRRGYAAVETNFTKAL